VLERPDGLRQPAGTRPERFVGDPRLVELGLHVTGAEPDLQAPVAEDVGRGNLPGQQRRIPEGGVEHQGADAEPVCGVCGSDQDRKRGRRAKMIRREDGVIAETLGQTTPVSEGIPRPDPEHVARESKVAHGADPAPIPACQPDRSDHNRQRPNHTCTLNSASRVISRHERAFRAGPAQLTRMWCA
jgi:hypothetical protein